jgi:hypothetical protein
MVIYELFYLFYLQTETHAKIKAYRYDTRDYSDLSMKK